MIEVELPDGSVAEFPEGTSNDVIKSALAKRFPAKTPPAKAGESPLNPYLRSLSAEATETGLPIQRPLALHYEGDHATWGIHDEYLYGRESELVEEEVMYRMFRENNGKDGTFPYNSPI